MVNHRKIPMLERQLKSRVKMRGRGPIDSLNNVVKNIDLDDPKTKLAIAVAPYVGKALWSMGKAGYKAINNRFGSTNNPNFQPALPGEDPLHAPSYNYLGPGSDVNRRIAMGVKPVNETDRAAMRHDLEYSAIQSSFRNGKITRAEAENLTRMSDNKLQKALSEVKPATTGETVINKVANVAIGAKKLGEDVGILDKGEFVGYGKKKPLSNLKKQALRQVGHGKKKKGNKADVNRLLSLLGAQLVSRYKKQRGGNLKQVTDSIGNFFNQTIPHTFTKTIPAPFIGAYNDTRKGIQHAYDTTLGY